MVVAVALIVGGIAILIIERFAQRPRIKSVDDIDWKTALFIGFCQCLAMIPGVSRSGATIMGARVLRVDRAAAAEFSFFLAIPTMLGADGLRPLQELVDAGLARQRADRASASSRRSCRRCRGREALRALRQPPRFRRLRLVPHCSRRIGARPVAHALKPFCRSGSRVISPRNRLESPGVSSCNVANSSAPPVSAVPPSRPPARSRRPPSPSPTPEIKWRLASSFPKSLDTIYGARRDLRQARRRGDRQQVPDPRLRRRRDRARPAGARRGAERHRRDGPHRLLLLLSARTRPSRFGTARAVRPERAPAECLDDARRRRAS